MQMELPGPRPDKRAAEADRRANSYQAAKPTSLSPIAAGSSQPPKFIRDIATHNRLVAQVDNDLRVLEEMPVGPVLAARLFALRGRELGVDGAVRATTLWHKLSAWTSAEAMVTTREALSSADFYVTSAELTAPVIIGQEIACATRMSMTSAMAQVTLTMQVSDTLPASWVALDRGEWSLAHLRALALVTQHSTPRVAGLVEARVVPAALKRGWTPAQVKKQALKVLAGVDPEGAAERAAKAKAEADVVFSPLPDETAQVSSYGDAMILRRLFDTLNQTAAEMRRAGDERSVGLRRFDALAKAVLGSMPAGRTAQALIAMSADTLLGGDAPGDLAGYGPVSSATARELATNSTWRKLILDPGTGEAIDIGMSAYRPNDQLIRFVKSRDWTCRHPGCNQPAVVCDCDHRKDHADGGPTNRFNLQMLCRLHHNMKTCKLWTSLIDDAGEVSWTSPLGHTYTVEPFRLLELLDEPPEEPAEPDVPQQRIEDLDPPWPDEPPPISLDQLEEYLDAIDHAERDEWFRANASYDQFRTVGLIA